MERVKTCRRLKLPGATLNIWLQCPDQLVDHGVDYNIPSEHGGYVLDASAIAYAAVFGEAIYC